jgi:hypothetical protein
MTQPRPNVDAADTDHPMNRLPERRGFRTHLYPAWRLDFVRLTARWDLWVQRFYYDRSDVSLRHYSSARQFLDQCDTGLPGFCLIEVQKDSLQPSLEAVLRCSGLDSATAIGPFLSACGVVADGGLAHYQSVFLQAGAVAFATSLSDVSRIIMALSRFADAVARMAPCPRREPNRGFGPRRRSPDSL